MDMAGPQNNLIVEITGLKKSFGRREVLKGIDFTLRHGESVVIFGKSGSGKSVLIKCISGLLKPDAGIIKILGKNILAMDHRELDSIREKMGFVFQSNALYDSMTVRKNLEFAIRKDIKTLSRDAISLRVQEVLNNVGLAETTEMMPSELSGGMQKRVGLARSLMGRPEIMLYDEPTTGLDPITAREIIQLILHTREMYQTSSIIISHDIECARLTADRMLILIDGMFYVSGTFEELEKSEDPKVKSYFK